MKGDVSNNQSTKQPLFHVWRCFWLSFLVLSLGYAWYCFYVPENDIAWADNYESAQRQAAATEKPLILYFTGTWCVPCRIMKREVWADEEVMAEVNSSFIPVAIDMSNSENAVLLARYNVNGAPVVIVTDSQGNALDWRAGGIGKSDFLEFIHSLPPAGRL